MARRNLSTSPHPSPHQPTKCSLTSARLILWVLGLSCLLTWRPPSGHAQGSYDASKQPWAILYTSRGTVVIKLFEQYVPRAVKHFIGLATGSTAWKDLKTKKKVKRPFYDGLLFHRVLPTYLVQTGCQLGNGKTGPGFTTKDEFHPKLRHQSAGMVGFANVGPNTNGSQFYITLRRTPWLDAKKIKGKYCANFSAPVRCVSDRDCADYEKRFGEAADGAPKCKVRVFQRGYTIFGKVVHGMDVLGSFSEVPIGPGGRPQTPITLKRVSIQIGKRWKRRWLKDTE